MQAVKQMVEVLVDQAVMVDGIGVGGGDSGTCGKVIGVDLLDETGVVNHHTRGPEGSWLVTGAGDKFLSHAAIEKRDLCHVVPLLDVCGHWHSHGAMHWQRSRAAMDYETVAATAFGHALRAISVNLLVRDVMQEVAFLRDVLGLTAHRVSADFAIMLHAGQPFQLHADHTYHSHPLLALLPEAGARGGGIELRLHEADPDLACAKAAGFEAAVILQTATDKPPHGLREAVILCPNGYAWIPSRRIEPV